MKPSLGSAKSAESVGSSLEVDMDALAKGVVSLAVPSRASNPYRIPYLRLDELTKAQRMTEWGEGYYGFKREQMERFDAEVLRAKQATLPGGD